MAIDKTVKKLGLYLKWSEEEKLSIHSLCGSSQLLKSTEVKLPVARSILGMQNFNVNIVREPFVVHQVYGTTPSQNMKVWSILVIYLSRTNPKYNTIVAIL